VLKIGLTGGIGSGKSTVAAMLAAKGAGLIDADAISRALTQPRGAAMPAIRAAFGDSAVAPNGSLNREAIRLMMLSDITVKSLLEGILHPLIGQRIDQEMQLAQAERRDVLITDIPLLVEGGDRWRGRLNLVWVVDSTIETQIARVQTRSGWPVAQIKAVIDMQASRAQRLAAADAVIFNEAISLSELVAQVGGLLQAAKASITCKSVDSFGL
jgi:dephospho-CoA kinase